LGEPPLACARPEEGIGACFACCRESRPAPNGSQGGKSFGGKSFGGKSFGGKSFGGKSFGPIIALPALVLLAGVPASSFTY
jgi:hypothetical protein